MKRGNCYVSSEALYHILGGKKAGWKPMRITLPDDTHWYIQHESGLVVDPSRLQFGGYLPDYTRGRGSSFMTKQPSKRAKKLIERLTWWEEK